MRLAAPRPASLLAWIALTMGCAQDSVPELRHVAYGSDPAWTIHVWSDSMNLYMEGDHGTHAFEVPSASVGVSSYETQAGEATIRLEFGDEACRESERLTRVARLSFGSQTYSGCGREPGLPISRYRDPGGLFTAAVPTAWAAIDESRSDTTAVIWRSSEPNPAELTVVSVPLTGGYSQDQLIELAESFVRARYPRMSPRRDALLARVSGAIRLPFADSVAGSGMAGRVVVDVEQEPGRLRLIGLSAERDAAVWAEDRLLFGGFQWLTPPVLPTAPEAPPVSS